MSRTFKDRHPDRQKGGHHDNIKNKYNRKIENRKIMLQLENGIDIEIEKVRPKKRF